MTNNFACTPKIEADVEGKVDEQDVDCLQTSALLRKCTANIRQLDVL